MKKNKVMIFLVLLTIISLAYYFLYQKDLQKKQEFFGFWLINLLMNTKDFINNENIKEQWYTILFEKLNSYTMYDLVNIDNESKNLDNGLLKKFNLIVSKKDCFVFWFDLYQIDSIFEPKKSQYINKMGRINYNMPWPCIAGWKCLFIFTEKWILSANEQYDCK
ncbi:MAG: hypothetical protein ACD_71C00176G0004 [uncultured bacterium (gcode 4)]|uniref:Uncharacterized protein n=1 Tax=uncultured bacterium (gcode 4) TaxID=1234023 RepID=K2A2U2_9BACT|nr:MAG: hypothetical protein ACD_71C00176G0004 [uncultured bacterium (gcode 4)]